MDTWPRALRQAHKNGLNDTRILAQGALAGLSRLPRTLARAVRKSASDVEWKKGGVASGATAAAAAPVVAEAACVTLPPGVPLPHGGLTLRDYQVEGIAWLDFLRRYGLGGILAVRGFDGMGGVDNPPSLSLPPHHHLSLSLRTTWASARRYKCSQQLLHMPLRVEVEAQLPRQRTVLRVVVVVGGATHLHLKLSTASH